MLPPQAPRSVLLKMCVSAVLIASFIAPTAGWAQCNYQNAFQQARTKKATALRADRNKYKVADVKRDRQMQNEQNQANQGGNGGDLFKMIWPMLSQLFNSMQGMSGTSAINAAVNNLTCPGMITDCTSLVSQAANQLARNGCLVNSASCIAQVQAMWMSTAGTSSLSASNTCPNTGATPTPSATDPIYSIMDPNTGQACVPLSTSASSTTAANINASCATQIIALETSIFNASCGANSNNNGGGGGGGGSGGGSSGGGGSGGGPPPFLSPTVQQLVGAAIGGSSCGANTKQPPDWRHAPTN
jgi:uncharacterized membrane protein YgcG